MLAQQTVLATAPGAFGSTWRLIHRMPGQWLAGSCTIPVDEAWGSIVTLRSGTFSGQWYKTEAEARTHFERHTTPITEITA
jgi:hypothetical protein